MDRIIRYSRLPLYHQVHEIERGNILNGRWQPGDTLPPGSELVTAC